MCGGEYVQNLQSEQMYRVELHCEGDKIRWPNDHSAGGGLVGVFDGLCEKNHEFRASMPISG